MLVLLAVGGITCVVWGTMLWLSFLDEKQVGLLRRPVKRSQTPFETGEAEHRPTDISRGRG
jgi:hypothetical protein